MIKILIADDEDKIRRLVSSFLKNAGYDTVEVDNGDDAYNMFENDDGISLYILDIMMPGLNGWEVCKKIREKSDVPIIMLTARSEEFDELMGYESGADDYVTKPFSPSVLVKRVEALLRRSMIKDTSEKSSTLVIDRVSREVYLDSKPVELTFKEFELLSLFYDAPGHVFTRNQLLDSVWGVDYVGDIRTVDSHVARLRIKLGNWGSRHIRTVYGVGYKFEDK